MSLRSSFYDAQTYTQTVDQPAAGIDLHASFRQVSGSPALFQMGRPAANTGADFSVLLTDGQNGRIHAVVYDNILRQNVARTAALTGQLQRNGSTVYAADLITYQNDDPLLDVKHPVDGRAREGMKITRKQSGEIEYIAVINGLQDVHGVMDHKDPALGTMLDRVPVIPLDSRDESQLSQIERYVRDLQAAPDQI